MLLAACAVTPDFTGSALVTLDSIEPGDRSGQVMLQLNLKNGTDAVMPVIGMSYRVLFNGKEFTYGSSRQAVEVPAHGEAFFEVTTPGKVPAAQSGDSSQLLLAYQLIGTINLAGGQTLPFDREGTLTWQAVTDP